MKKQEMKYFCARRAVLTELVQCIMGHDDSHVKEVCCVEEHSRARPIPRTFFCFFFIFQQSLNSSSHFRLDSVLASRWPS